MLKVLLMQEVVLQVFTFFHPIIKRKIYPRPTNEHSRTIETVVSHLTIAFIFLFGTQMGGGICELSFPLKRTLLHTMLPHYNHS